VREKSPETWVFWLHASSSARLKSSVRNILAQLGESGENYLEADIFPRFSNWLHRARSRNWLLILDSADSEDVLLDIPAGEMAEGQGQPCIDYLRPHSHGSLLVTTRTRSAALEAVDLSDIIMVKPMERKYALALLEKKLGSAHISEKVPQLAAELDFIPLAMVQAASYIRRRDQRCSVAKYIAKLQESDQSMRSLLKRNRKQHEVDHRRDREASSSIFVTWQISFEHISTTRKSAADLLSLMSCFDRQAIPEALLEIRDTDPDDLVANISDYNCKMNNDGSGVDEADNNKAGSLSDGDDDDDSSSTTTGSGKFEYDLLLLQEYSFISVTRDASTFEMHRLVQLATQGWLESRDSLEYWRSQFITNLNNAFPIGKFENWTRCRELFPHATVALKMSLNDRDALLRQASLLDNSGWYALEQGDYGVAKQMRKLSMGSRERILGPEDPATVVSMHNLALTYQNQGEYKSAVELGEQVVKIRKRSPGPEHPDTLISISNLAAAYRYLARLDLAAELQKQVLQIRERTLGPRNLDTAVSMNNLSTTYQYQGHYELAAELGEQALKIRKSMLGPEHPDIATSMSNLAMTFQHQGRYKQAAELGERALGMKRRVLRAEHPQVATSMSNLALTYRSQKLYDQAAELEEQALEMRKRGLKHQHPDTLISMSNLASTYRCQKRYEQAAKLGEQVLQIRKGMLNPDHPSIATSMGNLASTYRCLGLYTQAIELGRHALEIRKKALKHDHPHIPTSMRNLALSYQNQGLHKEAAELHTQVLEIRQRVLGPGHPVTLTSKDELVDALRALGYDDEAVDRTIRFAGSFSRVT